MKRRLVAHIKLEKRLVQAEQAKLRLLETTDLHMRLTGYDYILENHIPCGGLERLSGCIDAARRDGIETILCDNGDFLQGSPLAECAMELDDMRTHPMVSAMNALNYDAISLGNHEFDYGSAKLRRVIDALDAPAICSNVRVSQHHHFTTPWTIVERNLHCSDGQSRKIRVGLIGFVTPLKVYWGNHPNDEPLTTDDILAAAMTHLPAMRRAGADIAVALAHTGIGPEDHSYGMENAAYPLARLRGIDVLLLGHTHEEFPSQEFHERSGVDGETGTILGTPTVMAGQLGNALGQIDLELEIQNCEWQIVGQSAKIISSTKTKTCPDPSFAKALKEALAPVHKLTLQKLAKPVGTAKIDQTTYFTSVGFDPLLKLVALSKMDAVRIGLAGTPFESLPLVGAAASFNAGGRLGPSNYLHIPPGTVTAKHVSAISPFDNPVCAILRRGWQIREWLERISAQFNVVPDSPGTFPLINQGFPAYLFDTLHGLDYAFDLSAPLNEDGQSQFEGKSRVSKIQYGGTNVLDDDLFVVATSRYRAHGGGYIGHVPSSDIIYESEVISRQFISDRLRADHAWCNCPNWSFAALSDVKVVLESNPKAAKLIPCPRIKPLEKYANGYQSFELSL